MKRRQRAALAQACLSAATVICALLAVRALTDPAEAMGPVPLGVFLAVAAVLIIIGAALARGRS